MTLDQHNILNMKAGASDLQRAVERQEGDNLSMVCVPTATARAALEYVKHLGRLTGELELKAAGATDWRPFHSALSQCAELLDNMQDGDDLARTPVALKAKLEQLQNSRAQRTPNNEETSSGASPVAQQDERAMFEAWVRGEGWENHLERYNVHDPEDTRSYKNRHVTDQWEGWQARASLSSKHQDAQGQKDEAPAQMIENKDVEWLTQAAAEALDHPEVATKIRHACYAAARLAMPVAAPSVPTGGSIDTPEFCVMLEDYRLRCGASKVGAYTAIVAHIDTHVASKVQAARDPVQADEAKLYRELTGDAMAMGCDGIPAALAELKGVRGKVQAARDEAITEAASICTAAYKERGGVAFLYAEQEIRALRSPAATEDKE